MASLRDRFQNFIQFNNDENSTLENKENNKNEADIENPNQIAFEDENFRVFVQRTQHKREKRFHLQDHLFLIKIEPKKADKMPLLMDILDMLHASLTHVLDEIKVFYKPGNHLFKLKGPPI